MYSYTRRFIFPIMMVTCLGCHGNKNNFGTMTECDKKCSHLTSTTTCQFTRDCISAKECKNIADAGCICVFGVCKIDGSDNPLMVVGNECKRYTDCACKGSPGICFCRNGYCQSDPEKKFECHETIDCKSMAKCEGKPCACQNNLCEDVQVIVPVHPCLEEKAVGPCKAFIKKFYFDQQESKCKEFQFGGNNRP